MTDLTALDPARQYLVPVARLDLPGQPDAVHLSVYKWLSMFEAWATGPALCGHSTTQGPLPEGTEVTCADCLDYKPRYERMLAPGYRPEDDDPESLRAQISELKQERDRLRERLRSVTDETVAQVVGPNIELLCEEINRLKVERDVLRRMVARLADVVSKFAMFAFGRGDSRRRLLRAKWRTADRVLAYTSGPEVGCDCDRTALRRSPYAGHLITCLNHGGRRGEVRYYGQEAGR